MARYTIYCQELKLSSSILRDVAILVGCLLEWRKDGRLVVTHGAPYLSESYWAVCYPMNAYTHHDATPRPVTLSLLSVIEITIAVSFLSSLATILDFSAFIFLHCLG